MNTLAVALKNVLGQDTMEKIQAKSQPLAQFKLNENRARRSGINPRTGMEFNDSNIRGVMTLSLPRARAALAEARTNNWPNVQAWVDLWFKHNGEGIGPMVTGLVRNIKPADKRFVPTPHANGQERPASTRELPLAYIDLFPNNQRRTGVNPATQRDYDDSHLQGAFTLPLESLSKAIAEAEANGWDDVQCWVDMWLQHDGSENGPMFTGQARNTLTAEQRTKTRQTAESTTAEDADVTT